MYKFFYITYEHNDVRKLRDLVAAIYPSLNGVDFPGERYESKEEALSWLRTHSIPNHRAIALRVKGLSGWIVGGHTRETRQ